jgi:hypothetical protein
LLCTVTDSFAIEGRGCAIVPGVPSDFPLNVKVKDEIRLHRPDGSVVIGYVAGVDYFTGDPSLPFPILLSPNIQKQDVPIGTVVYWLQSDA